VIPLPCSGPKTVGDAVIVPGRSRQIRGAYTDKPWNTHKFRIQDIHPYDADGSTSASLVRDVRGIQEEEMDATGLVVALRDHIVDAEVVET
jgi:hypothetical protein